MRPDFFHHLHPPTIPARQSRWRHTLGAGGTAVFLLLVLVATGFLEAFYYVPAPADAAQSVQTISYLVPLGWLVRNLHFWAAQLLLVVSALHLVRVIFTGAYKPPRRFNYLLGLILFVVIVLLDFTGYILRWDQGIQWALVVGTNLVKTIPGVGADFYHLIIGGAAIGDATLVRFYAWHLFGLMLPAVILLVWHLFRVRRDGGIALPPSDLRMNRERISRFDLVRRETLAMLLIAAGLLLLASFVPAPIAPPVEELTSISSGEVLAPWFFLWVQQMLKWGDPFFWGVLVPLLFLALLAAIPYFFPLPDDREIGRWFPKSNRLAQAVAAGLGIILLLLTLLAKWGAHV